MRLLITAGPTHEPIDAVRYLANRSSGRVGIAIAEAARDAGHDVRLLLGPTHLPPPTGVAVDRYTTTAELSALLDRTFDACDVLVMAAAVADYTPALGDVDPASTKLQRGDGEITLRLRPTPDLVGGLAARRRPDQRIVAFALEYADTMIDRAAAKLARKHVDAIVANPLGTPDRETIDAAWLAPGAPPERSGEIPKSAFARWLLDRVNALMDS
ncbi:MAG: phosphopantothenoylcysteine decarboxylase [Planctomycetota bacterium]